MVLNQDVSTTKPKKRLYYLDFIRALSTIVIIVCHFNNPYLVGKGFLGWNEPFGIYIGNFGVSLFLIISGAALTVTYSFPIRLGRFYRKRFLSIYPMFWIAWIIATLCSFALNQGMPLNAGKPESFIFTIFAMDGLAANFGLSTTYLLGEWFLGFIVLFYLIFPLLLWGVKKYPIITICLGLTVYGLTLIVLQQYPHSFPNTVLLPVRLPELLFGIYYATYVHRRPHPLWLIPSVAVLILSTAYPSFNEDIATTFVGIASFISLAIIAKYFNTRMVRPFVHQISKYSYAIFLVHHVVISRMFLWINIETFVSRIQIYMLFTFDFLLTMLLAVLLYKFHKKVMAFVDEIKNPIHVQ